MDSPQRPREQGRKRKKSVNWRPESPHGEGRKRKRRISWRTESPRGRGLKRKRDSRGPESPFGRGKTRTKDRKVDTLPTKRSRVCITLAEETAGMCIPLRAAIQYLTDYKHINSDEYQRDNWYDLKTSIEEIVNMVDANNIDQIDHQLRQKNIFRGMGLVCQSIMEKQKKYPESTDVVAALVAALNSHASYIGDLCLRRVLSLINRLYKWNNKSELIIATKFLAHLMNQHVARKIMALNLLKFLLREPKEVEEIYSAMIFEDRVEVAIEFALQCGSLFRDVSPQDLDEIFARFQSILLEGRIHQHSRCLLQRLFDLRKENFQGFPVIRPKLPLVEHPESPDDEVLSVIFTFHIPVHIMSDAYRYAPNFKLQEDVYYDRITGEDDDDEDEEENAADDDDDDDDDEENDDDEDEEENAEEEEEKKKKKKKKKLIMKMMMMMMMKKMLMMKKKKKKCVNEKMLKVNFERKMGIVVAVLFEENKHNVLQIKDGQGQEICTELFNCCSKEKSYRQFYGLLGHRFCMIDRSCVVTFERCFMHQYEKGSRESVVNDDLIVELHSVVPFFAYLLSMDSLGWHVLRCIHLRKEVTVASKIFIKILFRGLLQFLGILELKKRLSDPRMHDNLKSIFPMDEPETTIFVIDFFTSIGLVDIITESLWDYVKQEPQSDS